MRNPSPEMNDDGMDQRSQRLEWQPCIIVEDGRKRKRKLVNPKKILPSSDSSEMCEGGEDNEKALETQTTRFRNTIAVGAQRTKSSFSSSCMFRVPENLRNQNSSAYIPHLISIGPTSPNSQFIRRAMRHVKMYYANNLFLRLTEGIVDPKKSKKKEFEVLKECLREMKKLVADAQKCYIDESLVVQLTEEMMVVDGCFILELLYKYYGLTKADGNKTIGGRDSGNSEVRKLRA